MSNVIVIGAQWGDEGKGKIVDWLSSRADMVIRFQGGHNAGHTLVVDGITYALSLLPSGIIRAGTHSLIGNGVVIEPWALFKEISKIRAQGVEISALNLSIADNAALILPHHILLDQAKEAGRGTHKIGTTGRGIGPAYEDKVARRALRTGDLLSKDWTRSRLTALYTHHQIFAEALGYKLPNFEELLGDLLTLGEKLHPYLVPAWHILEKAEKKGQRLLFEGAQGAMLDIDHGTYPFVTSSNTHGANAAIGSGFGGAKKAHTLGITKAYTTRVGSGPFPTEGFGEEAKRMAKRGHEFGTVTGRPRRCGWFDAPMVRQTVQIVGIDAMALTKLDVLDGFKTLKICVGYKLDGTKLDYFPNNPKAQEKLQPIYETLPGWEGTTAGVQIMEALPPEALSYVRRLEELVGIPATIISTSPKREDTILRADPFLA